MPGTRSASVVWLSALLLTCCTFVSAQQYLISTVAGGGPPTTPSPALTVSITFPSSIATDSTGNVYFTADNRVFKVDANGALFRIAGSNLDPGYSGDGGPATRARLRGPYGVAVDMGGNVYVADTMNHRIRKVGPDGVITTVAGNGSAGYSGDSGPATSAQLYVPHGVAVDAAGNVYISDSGNNRIRKVSPEGIITTIAGGGFGLGDGGPATAADLSGALGIALDAARNIYIAQRDRVRKVSSEGIITTVAGTGFNGFSGDDGPATSARLNQPSGVAVDTAGNLYVADQMNWRVRKVSPGGVINTVAGNGGIGFAGDGGAATSAGLGNVTGVAIDARGNLYVAVPYSNRIRKVSPDGFITTVAGNGDYSYSGDSGPAADAQLRRPTGIAVDGAGNLYIADADNQRIRKVSPDGLITTVAGKGIPGYSGDGSPATSAELRRPTGIAVDGAGNLYIADAGNQRIRKVSPDGLITTVAGNGTMGYSGDGGPATGAQLNLPSGVAVDTSGNLYIADTANYRIRKVSLNGIITTVAGNGNRGFAGDGGPATNAQLQPPEHLTVDATGSVYIADTATSLIRKVSPKGTITTVAGSDVGTGYSGDGGPAIGAQLAAPQGMAVDSAGNLYVAEQGRIRRISKEGIISTIAGDGRDGYSGDGGPATAAEFASPVGVAVDVAGNIYVTDYSNNAVRLLQPTTSSIPGFPPIGLVDAAWYQPGLAAGSIATIFGTGLAASATAAPSMPLPTVLNGTSVSVNGTVAPLFYVSPGQINFQLPFEFLGQSQVTVTVTANGMTSLPRTFNLLSAAPAIFQLDVNWQGAVVIGNSGIIAAPPGSVAGRTARPARRGEHISIFCTGLGVVTNPPKSGEPASADLLSSTLGTPTVIFGGLPGSGGAPGTVTFSGLAPGLVGVYQVNVQVPDSVQPGSRVKVIMNLSGSGSNPVFIAVE